MKSKKPRVVPKADGRGGGEKILPGGPDCRASPSTGIRSRLDPFSRPRDAAGNNAPAVTNDQHGFIANRPIFTDLGFLSKPGCH